MLLPWCWRQSGYGYNYDDGGGGDNGNDDDDDYDDYDDQDKIPSDPISKRSSLKSIRTEDIHSQIHQGVWAKLMVSRISSVSVALVHEWLS